MRKTIIFVSLIFCWTINFAYAKAQTKTITANTTLSQDTTWEDLVIIDGAKVTVSQNVTLTVKPGTTIAGKNGALLYVMGKLNALGEKDEKVHFTAEYNEKPNFSLTYYIDSTSTSEINLEHFILEKGGGNQDTASLPALTIRGKGTLSQGIVRRNQITGIRVWGSNVKIGDSEIYENESTAVENKSTTNTLNAENNWWGSEEGPTATAIPNSPRAVVKGAVDYDPWQKKGPIPIVIIPGFGGSFSFKLLTSEAKDDWWLTPLGTSAYRYFAKALVLSNYYHDKDFFWAFYDWRMSNADSAKKYLEKVIDGAKSQSGHSQVHLVAHSMGGLVARSYIQGSDFRDDVDQLVAAGAPNLGSSDVYPGWEGARFLDEKKPVSLYLWYLEALDDNWDQIDLIRKNFPSLGEMMPIYDYLKGFNDQLISYSNQKQKNPFLEDLAKPENLEKLKRRVTTNLLVGSGENTLEKIKVSPYEGNDSKWEDGIPNPLNPPPDNTQGDGMVTVKSASGDGALTKNIITVSSSHDQLLVTGTKPIFDQLKVKAKFPLLTKILSAFLLTATGPVKTIIKDSLGNILDSDNTGEEGVYEEQVVEGQKLLYAQFPQEIGSGESKTLDITFQGTEKGNFKAAAWNFGDSDDYSKEEIDNPISKGMELNYSVQVGANSLSITPRISIKNLMVLVDHWYEEGKITSWETRRELINRLAESYQAQSNNRPEEANEKINFVQDDVISKGLIQKIVVF